MKLDGPAVVAKHGQVQTVQVQFVKGIGQAQLGGLITVPLSPITGVPNGNRKPGYLIGPFNSMETKHADELIILNQANSKNNFILGFTDCLNPFSQRCLSAGASQMGTVQAEKKQVLFPKRHDRSIRPAQGIEPDPLASQ